MTDEKIKAALDMAIEASREAGEKLKPYFGNIKAETKDNSGAEAADVVTRLDREVELFLSERFKVFDPNIGFRGEEFGVEHSADITWLVDPIDGTSHFIRGIPFCSTMISLIENNRVVLSVINDFVRKETFWAIRGGGAYRDGQKIHVSNRTLNKSLISFESNLEKSDNLTLFLALREKTGGIVNTINCGFEFTQVAQGKLDARITKDPYGMDWDFAAGTLLVEEAGGIVKNHNSSNYDYRNHDFIAANPVLFQELVNENIFLN